MGSLGCVPGRCSFVVVYSGSDELVTAAALQHLWREASPASWCDLGSDGFVFVDGFFSRISSSVVVGRKKDHEDLCAFLVFYEVLSVIWLQLCLRICPVFYLYGSLYGILFNILVVYFKKKNTMKTFMYIR